MLKTDVQRRVENLVQSYPDGSGWRHWHGRISHEVVIRSDVADLQIIKEAYSEAATRLQEQGFKASYFESLEHQDSDLAYYRIGVAIGRG